MEILTRYVLALMGAFGVMNMYFCRWQYFLSRGFLLILFRINLSSAIVAMVGVEPKLLKAENTNSHKQIQKENAEY